MTDYKQEIQAILDDIPGDWRIYFEAEKEATQALTHLINKASYNCNIADDQPNDVHIQFFNAGYRKGKADAIKELEDKHDER